jgi:hypothetical protein
VANIAALEHRYAAYRPVSLHGALTSSQDSSVWRSSLRIHQCSMMASASRSTCSPPINWTQIANSLRILL